MPTTLLSLRGALLSGAALVLVFTLGGGAAKAGPVLGDTVHVTSEAETETADTAWISFSGLPGGGPLNVYTAPELLSGTFGVSKTAFTNLLAYCTDLYHYSSPATYKVGSLTSSQQPTGANDLTTTQVNEIATLISANHSDQAATQLAIWSVEYGSAFSFSGASSSTTTDERNYLGALTGSAPANVIMYQLQADNVQGFAYTVPVPEPMSIALLGVAMVGIQTVRRRRAHHQRATA